MNKTIFLVSVLILAGLNLALPSVATAQSISQQNNWFGHHLPFDPNGSSPAVQSNKKVFAHYFLPYPVSINNRSGDHSYYNKHYLNPHGENDKFLNKGGLLRQRPLPRVPLAGKEHFRLSDLRHEIQLAKAIGIDGFAVNILSLHGQLWQQTLRLLQVAEEQDFTILIMPDMNAQFKAEPEYLVPLLKYLDQYSNAHRLQDGRLVVAPYMAENQSPQWWADVIAQLNAAGVPIAFVPVFHDMTKQWQNFRQQLKSDTRSVLSGISEWGPRTPLGADRLQERLQRMHKENLLVMSPVAPQDMRPKSSIFTEANNSESYRRMWESTINADADWVHIITWNDYSESTEIAPSTETGYAFYDLTAYYIHWFKQGKPPIRRDALYAFYRNQPWQASTTFPGLDRMNPRFGYPAKNEIELLGFLTEPGTLLIGIDEKVERKDVDAGMVSFKIPMQSGTPYFALLRNGQLVQSIKSGTRIRNQVEISNLIYRGETSRRINPQAGTNAVSWPWLNTDFGKQVRILNLMEKSPFEPLTDNGAYVLEDQSSVENGGIGFSFPKAESESFRIQFDVKATPKGSQSLAFVFSILQDAGKPIPLLHLLGKKDGAACLVLMTQSNRCKVNITLNTWYRMELSATSPRNNAPAVWRLSLRDGNGVVVRETLSIADVKVASATGLLIDSIAAPEIRSKLFVDNLVVTADRSI